jgi:PAS domain-containing protein
VILRIVLGRFASGFEVSDLVTLRDRIARSAAAVNGLESLLIGVRARASSEPSPSEPDVSEDPSAAIVSVWRDVEAMRRATVDDEEDRLIAGRLELPFRGSATHSFELVDRAFGALPPGAAALLRIVTIRARLNEEARLFEILRKRQPRMIDRGLVGSQLARRLVAGGEVEAVVTALWPDRSTVEVAVGGSEVTALPDPEDLGDWHDRLHIDAYDAIEIAPRLPAISGPPVFILDGDLRIVDITPSAAAILGMPPAEMIGSRVDELSLTAPDERQARWDGLLRDGSVAGEAAWRVPETGTIQLRFVARRDVPIPGRHAVMVRRRLEAAPTLADLDSALAEAFGTPVPS